ncbi:MAG TPA: DUF1269 domain-containing protein [Chloroflexota bacterium]|jgi:uncharacterized membrane protein
MSSTVIGISFDNPAEAARLKTEVQSLQTDGLLKLEDAAVVVRDADGKVSYDTGSAMPGAGTGAIFGSLWGLLIGSIFLMPVAGVAMGAAAGAISGHFGKVAVDESFKQRLNDGLRPNTSALLLRVANVSQADQVLARIKTFIEQEKIGGQIMYTNLSPEAEQAVQAALKV